MKVTAIEIARLINEVYDGVERSKCGEIQQKVLTELPNGKKDRVLNNLAYQTYLVCLNNVFPKNMELS